jgi:hypothetical protein
VPGHVGFRDDPIGAVRYDISVRADHQRAKGRLTVTRRPLGER